MTPSVGRTVLAHVIGASLFLFGCTESGYRVVERRDRQGGEVHLVLSKGDKKLHSVCDLSTLNHLDPSATCALRVGRNYQCEWGPEKIGADTPAPYYDIRCKDANGHSVYLYVNKEE